METVYELQQLRRDEPDDQGELSDTYWNAYFPADTVLRSGDAIIDGVDGREYELVGDSWAARNPRTQLGSHVEATLRKTSGDEDVS